MLLFLAGVVVAVIVGRIIFCFRALQDLNY